MMLNKRGQGTTEYLVILAVVIIIALIVAAVLGWFPGFSGAITEQQSRAYWSSTGPLSITQYNIDQTNTKIVIRNNSTEKIQVNDVSFGTTSLGLADTNITGGNQVAFTSSAIDCDTDEVGKQFSYDVEISYSYIGGINNATQRGIKPIVGTCS